MREYLVYLAGPITGLSYTESTDWRSKITKKLPKHVKAVSPLRGKEYLKNEDNIKDSYERIALSSRKGITTRDRFDIMRCDLIFVNLLGATKVSIGTVMEIAWADILHKPIIVVMEEENIHNHAMLCEVAGFIVTDLDQALDLAKAILSP